MLVIKNTIMNTVAMLNTMMIVVFATVAVTVGGCDTKKALDLDAATPFNSHKGLGSVVENTEQLRLRSFSAGAPLTLLPQNELGTDCWLRLHERG